MRSPKISKPKSPSLCVFRCVCACVCIDVFVCVHINTDMYIFNVAHPLLAIPSGHIPLNPLREELKD